MEAEEKKGYVNQLYLNLYCLRFTCGAECECNMFNNYENWAHRILTVFVRYLRSATSSRRVIGIVGLGGKGWQSNSMTAETLGRRPDGGGQWLTPREPPLFPLPSKYVRNTKGQRAGGQRL